MNSSYLGSSDLTAESHAEANPHILIRQQMESTGWGPELDERLALCKDAECQECSRIVCPSGDSLHFHHDGCPACEAAYQAMEREARLRHEFEEKRRQDAFGHRA